METVIRSPLFQKLYRTILKSKNILVVVHQKPDGDALGSASAFLGFLKKQKKQITAFCVSSVPKHYFYLPFVREFTNDSTIFEKKFDLICVLDSGDLQQAGLIDFFPKMLSRPLVVNIDHHATNTQFGDLNLCFPKASSTAEIIYLFYKENKIFIESGVATGLLTGILTDTSNFINSATNATCVQAASDLLICGARLGNITNSLVRNKSISALQLWGRALENLRENKELGIASTVITQKDLKETSTIGSEAMEGIANFLVAVLDIPVIMVLQETLDGLIKGSLRSTSRDVSKIAQLLGGGGHKKAAGFSVKGEIILKDGIWQVK